jgi:hypothetical protein
MKGKEERCLASDMDAYLMKPMSIERLQGNPGTLATNSG